MMAVIIDQRPMKSTVLLIDDDPLDLKSLAMLLESWGLQVVPARSGEEALRHLEAAPADLVLSDVRMPGLSGEDVAREVAARHPGLPVLLITAHGDVRSAVRAMKLGAFDYCLKPADEDELRLAVERAIEHARLRRENAFLRAELSAGGMYGERLIGRSPKMLEVFDLIQKVAGTDSTVLITGETGTGKELVAQTVHFKSRRAAKPLVAVNCAAFNPNLIESELFGHEKGAFTGAVAARRGRFEDADGGTLFLDEIAETSLEFQSKLLRVLQEGTFERVGGSRPVRADVRLVASTNRELQDEVKGGKFRQDLYYRLRVIPIHVPPLRERREDIPLLAEHFLASYGRRYAGAAKAISRAGQDYLAAQDWRGNVRELQHVIERAVVLARQETLGPEDLRLPDERTAAPASAETLEAALDRQTREHLLDVLDRTGWRKQSAAEALGIDRATLYRMIRKYSLGPKD